jgi:hypothetical protein
MIASWITPARAMLFSIVGAATYVLAEYFNWPLFRYYLHGGFHFAEQPQSAGHVIHWYGWIATAALAGLVAALIAPKRLAARLPADLTWMALIALIAAVLVYEKRWFF